ncbi:Sigma 54 interacting domain protein [Pseudodesulfovibrio mercurii]|uniref:Sigma 54 interacting domain protein n=1 Tax=Pseudodesulfovibrio mercurii TaxID=641491 RepID=F0JCH8_9BACT|nr:sigma 54-interacting transcriptional regulator [Pseudodesulfovibrio mercurii]EGB15658.1 Sigma 54 interacting domain protein [Pseudodesulfovibrio mercurii]
MHIAIISDTYDFADTWRDVLERIEPGLGASVPAHGPDQAALAPSGPAGPVLLIIEVGGGNGRQGPDDRTLARLCAPGGGRRIILSGPSGYNPPRAVVKALRRGRAVFVPSDLHHGLAEAARIGLVRRELALRGAEPAPAGRPPVYTAISQPLRQWGGLRSSAPVMHRLFRFLANIARTDDSLLLVGEPGVGKTFLARTLHEQSPRQNGPFVVVNAGAVPDGMVESELFGYMRGAFTGAVRDFAGKFMQADTGTVFLDEIGDTTPLFQVKLLSFLTDRVFYPLGSSRLARPDIRIIYGTNQDIDELVRTGRWRADFRSRICQNVVMVPPLRERREDIPDFARDFLDQRPFGRYRLTADAQRRLVSAEWKENIRELDNTLRQAANLVAHEADEHGVCVIDTPALFPHLAGNPRPAQDRLGPSCPPGADRASLAEGLYGRIRAARERQRETPHYRELAKRYGFAVVIELVGLAMRRTQGRANAAGSLLGFYAPDDKRGAIAFTQWLRDNGTSASALRRTLPLPPDYRE